MVLGWSTTSNTRPRLERCSSIERMAFSSCLTGLSYRVAPSRSRACAWCALLPTSRPTHTSMSSGVIIVPPVMKVFPVAVDSEESGRPAPHPHYDETCAMRP